MSIRTENRRRRGVRQSRTRTVHFERLEARTVLSTTSAGALLVQVKDASTADLAAAAERAGATLQPTGLPGVLEATGTSTALRRLSGRLAVLPGLGYVEPSQTFSIDATPNDPGYVDNSQWGLNGTAGIDAPTAWNATTGSSTVVVAVVDTGVDYNHPDLYQNMWINQAEIPASRRANLTDVDGDGLITFYDLNYTSPGGSKPNQGVGKIVDSNGDGLITGSDLLVSMGRLPGGADSGQGGWSNGVSDDGDQYVDDIIGWNFVAGNNNPLDDHGHGTHVAGIIGATGNNGVGVSGVDWRVQIMALKFLDSSGSGSDVDAAAATLYAAAHGARVSNNSYGAAGTASTTFDSAIAAAAAAGSVFVAAAGNSALNTDVNPFWPASSASPNVVSVAAIASDGTLASFSNYGRTTVDVAAPGVSILSTLPGNRYGYQSGTSMASPFVSGAAALLLAAHPEWTYTQIITQIESTATPVPALQTKLVTGGRLNVGAALPRSGNAATFLGADAATQGSWRGVRGAAGYALAGSATSLPAGVSLALASASSYTWAAGSADVRALQDPAGTGRTAATWYSASAFSATLSLGAQPRTVGLYFVDWDGSARSQRVDVLDADTGALLDSRTVASFHDGLYLSWSLAGRVQLRITRTAGVNAVLSGLFLDGEAGNAATFLGADATTQGSWRGVRGAAGYALAGSATSLPAGVSLALASASSYTWAAGSADVRALQDPAGTGRTAATWYSASAFSATLSLGAQPRTVGLYFVDWDGSARSQRVDVLDADTGALLDSRTVASFHDGLYLSWSLAGRVQLRITRTAGVNAVLSGLFLDGEAGNAATFLGADATTQGSWRGVRGAAGYALAGSATSLPAGVSLALASASSYTWAAGSADVRALQDPAGTGRTAATWYSASAFSATLSLGAQPRTVGLYFVDWDGSARSQRVDVLDADTGALLDSRTVASFHDGLYLSWSLAGRVQLRITRTAGVNAVLSGLFLDGEAGNAATFLGADATTQGSWRGVRGAAGYALAGSATSLPAGVSLALASASSYTWAAGSADVRALQDPAGTGRTAATWYSASAFSATLSLGAQPRTVGLYFVDWDGSARSQRVDVLDADTGALLDSRTVASFHDGLYLSWSLAGRVQLRITRTAGVNAVLSGLFLD
ncbi:S8 family serine peptidase [Paludisphaera mucosa]|uniref:S8 family serine peptidase n=1 Tax=Paludisphaera mucosa TaxID=3030827 RepID=A0ABT6F4P7_9BACT|nr:S8 family serine peptidase [Paludisphaera mucosa]MDG3002529.1 S8 family serine peptidase [Paludisphaera mucosa]